MIDWLVDFAFRKRLVAAMICILAAIYGYYSLDPACRSRPTPTSPTPPRRSSPRRPGLAAEEVEQQVTIPLERELNGTPGLR